jgi:ribose 5-phosphate isomerase A
VNDLARQAKLDAEKQVAARASLDFIQDGQVVGLGSGSTAAYFIQFLAERVRAGLKIRGVPTSIRSRDLAASLGIPLVTLRECTDIDIDIDGADEVDSRMNLIKGGGGALLREKIIASAARNFVVIGDSAKHVPTLGAFPLPIEIVAFAEPMLVSKISTLGADVCLRCDPDGTPFKTDEGHQILDCKFGKIADPATLARQLKDLPGVVEHGLFIGMADVVLIGRDGEVTELRRT